MSLLTNVLKLWRTGQYLLPADSGFMVKHLFANGEQGAWYDPSDLPTLFQDTAGTTPVTAVEQAVALMLDKSGRGNHASQATSTKRPKYSRRVNLLTKTEDFSDAAAWSKAAGGTGTLPVVTPNAALAPDGTMTACQIVFDQGAGTTVSDRSLISQAIAPMAVNYDGGLWLRTVSGTATLVFRHAAASAYLSIPVTTTWTYFSRRELGFAGAGSFQLGKYYTQATGSSTVLAWGASLTLAIDAHLPYQRVNTDTDYDADPAKFPGYLRFDGVDDALQTGNIDFTGTDKMTVWAGVTKLSDAALGAVAEFGSSTSVVGMFGVYAPSNSGATIGAISKGTSLAFPAVSGHTSPKSTVLTVIGDISGDIATVRVDGVPTTISADQGTGNYGNYPLYIGARAGNNLFLNGKIYSLIVRGAQSSLSQIEATENLIRKTMRLP